jgi:signal peptidase II
VPAEEQAPGGVETSSETVQSAGSNRMLRFAPSQASLAGLSVTIGVLDQVTKAIVRATLPLHQSVPVIPGFLDITHVRNTGAAFGLLNAADIPFKPALMTMIALAALIAIGVYALRAGTHQPFTRVGLAFVVGGAVGNLIDRVSVGYVLDFVDVYWRGWHFWAFNVADAAISVGASLLILDMLLVNRHVSSAA